MMGVEGIHFSYGDREILKDVGFRVEDNTVVSILGPNGTGKTTLLRCLCGLHRPDSGRVTVDGADIAALRGRELAKVVGFVPQSVPVTHTSVFDTVLIGRRPYIEWTATSDDLAKVGSVIDALGMRHLSLKYCDQISGGEYQKTQIARALVQEPSVLILDEPTNNLDMSNQHMTMHMIMDAVRSRGMSTVMTMHDINLAVHYSDRFLFMKDGRVAAYGGLEVITEDLMYEVYGIDAEIVDHRGVPFVVPSRSEKYRHLTSHSHPHDVHDHIQTGYTGSERNG